MLPKNIVFLDWQTMGLAKVTHHIQVNVSCPWISAAFSWTAEVPSWGCDNGQNLPDVQGLAAPPPACPLAVLSQGRDQEPEARADGHLQKLTPKRVQLVLGGDSVTSCIRCVNRPSRKSLPPELHCCEWTAGPCQLQLTVCCNPAASIKTAAALYA